MTNQVPSRTNPSPGGARIGPPTEPRAARRCSCAQGLDRRQVLLGGSGAAVALALAAVGCGGSETDEGPLEPLQGRIPAGHVADYPVGTVRRVDEGPVFVVRDAAGLYAMSAVCTHLGCTLTAGATELPCGCHGSRFDLDGAVLQGPADAPLRHYAVYVESDGRVTVDTTVVVDVADRTAV